jgi:GNAT superfamily N-acetyltransferase
LNKYLLDIATFPGDVLHAWRTDGANGLWTELAERTLFRIARSASYNIYERDLSTVPTVPAPEGVEIRLLDPGEHTLLASFMTQRRRAQLVRDIESRTIFVALREGVIVGYSWWTPFIDSPLDFSPLSLPANATFHGFVHVERAERKRGTASALFSAGERYLHRLGAQTCWFIIKSTNIGGARTARGRLRGRSKHIAELSYRKTPFRTRRTVTLAPAG